MYIVDLYIYIYIQKKLACVRQQTQPVIQGKDGKHLPTRASAQTPMRLAGLAEHVHISEGRMIVKGCDVDYVGFALCWARELPQGTIHHALKPLYSLETRFL